MASIAGIMNGGTDVGPVKRMLAAMAHRGADQERCHQAGAWVAGVASSTLSPARGDGFASDGSAAVLLDGELYNAREAGPSDADVILQLYRSHGRLFPAYLDGVFACAVLDGDALLLARDGVGVRPLYFGRTDDGTLVFASEMKALVGMASAVEALGPATTWSPDAGAAGYLPRLPEATIPAAAAEAAGHLRSLLMRSVERRLEDGAVGACLLSGGLDSSIIAAAVKALGADLPMVTVGLAGAPDIENAKLMAEHLGMRHHLELYEAGRVAELVPHAVWTLESFEEDCVSGTISNLIASARARELTNCILSGEGGDELFGGYHLLKDLPTDQARLQMMRRLIEVAHNTALQRLDRAMMGNGIHYRTPFIDSAVMAFALQLPVQWKIRDAGGHDPVEKWILREAFRDLLPPVIYRRSKLRFAAGTGTDDLMDRVAEEGGHGQPLTERTAVTAAGYRLSSPKERWYYRLFKERFPAPVFEGLVGRWDPGK